MSGYYDCWDLGGLDTTLNSYLAGVRAPKTPSDIAPKTAAPKPTTPKPADTFATPAPSQPAIYVQPAAPAPPPPAPTIVKKQKLHPLDYVLPMLLSPITCIFLWMLVAVLVTMLLTRRKSQKKKHKYKKYGHRRPFIAHMRGRED